MTAVVFWRGRHLCGVDGAVRRAGGCAAAVGAGHLRRRCEPTPIRVDGDGLHDAGAAMPHPATAPSMCRWRSRRPVTGEQRAARVLAGDSSTPFDFTVAEPGWTMYMVSHFHYDPVWWNTQAAYTSVWTEDPPGRCRQTQRLRPGARAPRDGPARPGLQVRARRGRLPQAVLGHPPRGPRRPAPAASPTAGSR